MNKETSKMEDQGDSKPVENKLKAFFGLGELFGYFFRKKDPSRPRNFNLRMMHGINKISMIIFLIAFVIWLVKRLS
jgi:hypothetical protein